MKYLRENFVYFIIPAVIVVGGMFLAGSEGSRESNVLENLSEDFTPVSMNPPDDLNFAGEVVPLHQFDVQERLDQELIRNIFYHSSTIMILKRAERWKEPMMKILEKHDIPKDFFYLCVAESHLKNVTSPVGAKGFWQFMPQTAREYGLTVNSQVDERYDPIKSTYAACKYLRDAYEKFGNWTLVAASYNMGMAGVNRAINTQKVDNYYDLYLNSETAAYVFRILALKCVLGTPKKYGFDPEAIKSYGPLRYKTVIVEDTSIDLIPFALKNGTTYKALKLMNPWLKKDELNAKDKKFSIRIPVGSIGDSKGLGLEPVERKAPIDSIKPGTPLPDSIEEITQLPEEGEAEE